MKRKIDSNEEAEGIITNEEDNTIDHTDSDRKYLNLENNYIIYKRLEDELTIEIFPTWCSSTDFGMGDICLEESNNSFKFYIMDRDTKLHYSEFDTIEAAVERLVSYYRENDLVDDSNRMKMIFYETFSLNEQEKMRICGSGNNTLKLRK